MYNPEGQAVRVMPFANRPAAGSLPAGSTARFSDLRYSDWYTDGVSRWKPLGGSSVLLAELNSDIVLTGTAEIVALQALLPRGMLLDGAILRIAYDGAKSGNADSLTVRMRVGPAGTVADALVKTSTALMQGSSPTGATYHELIRASATAMNARGANNIANVSSMTSVTGAGYATPITIGDFDATVNYCSLTLQSSGSSDVITIKRGANIELVTVGN